MSEQDDEFKKITSGEVVSQAREIALQHLKDFSEETYVRPDGDERFSSVELLPCFKGIVEAIGVVAARSAVEVQTFSYRDNSRMLAVKQTDDELSDVILKLVETDSNGLSSPTLAALVPGHSSLLQLEVGQDIPSLQWRRSDIKAAISRRGIRELVIYAPFEQPGLRATKLTDWDPNPHDPSYMTEENARATGYIYVVNRLVGSLVRAIEETPS